MPDSELWATDPTGSSASPVASLLGGRVSSPAATDDHLFFVVDSDSIWVTDGTATGTGSRVAGNPEVQWVHAAGEALYFADEALEGFRLWRLDPADVPFDLTRLADGLVSSPAFPAGAGGQLFFVADDGVHGRELWVSGGTPQSTRRLSDIAPGELLSAGADGFLAPLGDRILFQATDREHGSELRVSDGTAPGTRLVVDVNPDWVEECAVLCPPIRTYPSGLTLSGGRLVFVARSPDAPGPQLWVSDGSASGTPPRDRGDHPRRRPCRPRELGRPRRVRRRGPRRPRVPGRGESRPPVSSGTWPRGRPPPAPRRWP